MLDSVAELTENSGQNGAVCAADRSHQLHWRESALPVQDSNLSPRTRFEVFKRDNFTCRYCGRTTPAVVLEVDHIVPRCEGGSNDPLNLTTACWECNRGKAGNPLENVIIGEDPTERAVLMLERERQLREYDAVLAGLLERRIDLAQDLLNFWCEESLVESVPRRQFQWLVNVLEHVPATVIKESMLSAIVAGATKDWRYVMAIVRNKRKAQ